MANPYSTLPPRNFWKTAISSKSVFELEGLYNKKFDIRNNDRIATAGSCFAQHVGTRMRAQAYNIVDLEPAPPGLSDEDAKNYGYGLFSARYGNIYTVRQMLQLLEDAASGSVRDEDFVIKNGKYIDALRPSVEPAGYDSLEEARFNRGQHLLIVHELFSHIDLFVFTLGLTEAWFNKASGTVYPICPDVLTDHSSENYQFRNFGFVDIFRDLIEIRKILKSSNRHLRMLLTVSPVPLTATATDKHVLVATTYSKSTLRSVCGNFAERFPDVDYFPSYEIITSSLSRGVFYEQNLRNVNKHGVNTAMGVFFSEHKRGGSNAAVTTAEESDSSGGADTDDDVICDEVLLESFAR